MRWASVNDWDWLQWDYPGWIKGDLLRVAIGHNSCPKLHFSGENCCLCFAKCLASMLLRFQLLYCISVSLRNIVKHQSLCFEKSTRNRLTIVPRESITKLQFNKISDFFLCYHLHQRVLNCLLMRSFSVAWFHSKGAPFFGFCLPFVCIVIQRNILINIYGCFWKFI